MINRIIIFGSNGMLGNYISKYMNLKGIETICLTRKDLDLNEISRINLKKFMDGYNLDNRTLVVNAAGIIPQSINRYNLDKVPLEKMFLKVNTIFPIMLSQICEQKNAKMIHITTDCVFNGEIGKYTEYQEHTASDIYGITKSLAELSDCTIIRTSIIGEEVRNKKSLLEWVKSNKGGEINGYVDFLWNGVTSLELTKIIYNILTNNTFWSGIRNIFSPRIVSKYELVHIINEVYNLNIKINKFKAEKSTDKSLASVFNTCKSFNIPDIYDQMVELKKFTIL